MAPIDLPLAQSDQLKRGLTHCAVGVHGFPGTQEFDWQNWPIFLPVRSVGPSTAQQRSGLRRQVFSTWNMMKYCQMQAVGAIVAQSGECVLKPLASDLHPDITNTQDGRYCDVNHYHRSEVRRWHPQVNSRLWADENGAATFISW